VIPEFQVATPLSIRLATPDDIPRLVPMINSAYTVETFLEGTRTDSVRLANKMRDGEMLLAEDNSGQLIGCIYTEVHIESDVSDTSQKPTLRGYLGMLAVDPAHQHLHYGRTLMRAAEDHLRRQGCVAVDIDVIYWRTELPPIYRRYGYVETGLKDFDPEQPVKQPGLQCRAILMSKPL
jgi:predicted N-acetyltransferase YhbS